MVGTGAIEYAKSHSIALVKFADGSTTYLTRSEEAVRKPDGIPDYAGWMYPIGDDGKKILSVGSRDYAEYLDRFLSQH